MSAGICGDMSAPYKQLMQQYIGSQYRMYSKTADLTAPGPANTWVFCDESMYTLNDGYLQPSMTFPGYPDIPAAYDVGGNCFSFTDGHVEYKHWQFTRTSPVGGIPMAPYLQGVTRATDGGPNPWPAAPGAQGDGDWLWLRNHTSVPN